MRSGDGNAKALKATKANTLPGITAFAGMEKDGFYGLIVVRSPEKGGDMEKEKQVYSELEIIAGIPLAELEADRSTTIH